MEPEKYEDFWKKINKMAGECQTETFEIMKNMLKLRVEAMVTMLEFASIYGINYVHFQNNEELPKDDSMDVNQEKYENTK